MRSARAPADGFYFCENYQFQVRLPAAESHGRGDPGRRVPNRSPHSNKSRISGDFSESAGLAQDPDMLHVPAEVVGDGGGAYDRAVILNNRRHRERHRNDRAILSQSLGVESAHRLAVSDLAQQVGEFLRSVGGNQNCDVMSEHFCSLVAVETFGSGIPEHHLAVACFSDNGIIGRSDEGGQEWLSVQSIPTARERD